MDRKRKSLKESKKRRVKTKKEEMGRKENEKRTKRRKNDYKMFQMIDKRKKMPYLQKCFTILLFEHKIGREARKTMRG